MKLSERLFSAAEDLWLVAADKEFLKKMAKGTLSPELFKNYMIQDYLYLKDYIEILKEMTEMAEDEELASFLQRITQDTEYETYKVHVPSLRALGITDEDIEGSEKGQVITDYIGYMKAGLRGYGILAGITALLQCSWNYAYIARLVADRYSDELPSSPYKEWFEAYTASSYVESNQLWIDMVDERTVRLSEDEADRLTNIFRNCAEYENKLWDFLLG